MLLGVEFRIKETVIAVEVRLEGANKATPLLPSSRSNARVAVSVRRIERSIFLRSDELPNLSRRTLPRRSRHIRKNDAERLIIPRSREGRRTRCGELGQGDVGSYSDLTDEPDSTGANDAPCIFPARLPQNAATERGWRVRLKTERERDAVRSEVNRSRGWLTGEGEQSFGRSVDVATGSDIKTTPWCSRAMIAPFEIYVYA